MNRIEEGFCMYPNPIYPKTFYRVSLTPNSVNGFVFWTRHAEPMLDFLSKLDQYGYTYYFLYTIVNYPRNIEPHSPSADKAIAVFSELSKQIGKSRVIWRYDPILYHLPDISESWHKENFVYLLNSLCHVTETVIVSLIDPYRKTLRRLGTPQDGLVYEVNEYTELLQWMVNISHKKGVRVQSCCESILSVSGSGINSGSCVNAGLMENLSGHRQSYAMHHQREGCLCHRSIDIGVNNTCCFGCQYCYATENFEKALQLYQAHQPHWTCIISP